MKRVRLRHGSRKFENDEWRIRRRSIDMEWVELYIIITSYYWKERVEMLETMGRQSRKNNYKAIVVVGGKMRGTDPRRKRRKSR